MYSYNILNTFYNINILFCRCTIKGVWFGNRMTYPPHEEAPLRTDESFCKQTQKEYHKGISSLITRL